MANFTPGPYTCAGPKGEDGYPLYYSSVILDHDEHALVDEDEELCELSDWPFNREEQNANALLFAAAPDMYEALNKISELICEIGTDWTDPRQEVRECHKIIDKVITKAEGRDTR